MTHHTTIHNRDEDLSRMVVKGTWSRDVLELCSRPKQGSRQVFTFFVYFSFKQKIFFFIFLASMRTSLHLTLFAACFWSKLYCFLFCFLWLGGFANSTPAYSIIDWYEHDSAGRQSPSIIENHTSNVITCGYKHRRMNIRYLQTFCIIRQEFLFC
jgi:hypothetical protein